MGDQQRVSKYDEEEPADWLTQSKYCKYDVKEMEPADGLLTESQ